MTPATYKKGDRVILLKTPKVKGEVATISYWDEPVGKWKVSYDGGGWCGWFHENELHPYGEPVPQETSFDVWWKGNDEVCSLLAHDPKQLAKFIWDVFNTEKK